MSATRARLVIDPVAGGLRSGDHVEPCADLHQPRTLLTSYLRMVWRANDLPEGSRLRLRVEDLQVLADWLGVGVVAIAALLSDLIHDPSWFAPTGALPPPDPASRCAPPVPAERRAAPEVRPRRALPPVPPLTEFRPAVGADWSELVDDPWAGLPAALAGWDPGAPLDEPDPAWGDWLATVPLEERERALEATFGPRRRLRRTIRRPHAGELSGRPWPSANAATPP